MRRRLFTSTLGREPLPPHCRFVSLALCGCAALCGCGDAPLAGGTSSTGNTVSARVLKPDGSAAAGDSVLLRRDTAAVAPPRLRLTDAEGRVAFDDVPAGSWVLEARSEATGRLVRLALGGRDSAVDLRTDAYSNLSGRIIAPSDFPQADVKLVGTGLAVQADSSGTFRFERVSPGTHRIEALPRPDGSLGTARWEAIEVAAGEAVTVSARAPVGPRTTGWALAWSEEFHHLDTARWNIDTGDGCPALCGWGNGSLQRFDAAHALVREGLLVLRAESLAGAWNSGSIQSKGRVEFQYGRFEFRARMPAVRGAWGLLALFGDSTEGPVWPAAGAIDVAGLWGYRPDNLMGIAHRLAADGSPNHPGGALLAPGGWGDRWVTFAVEWSPREIVWLADDQVFHRVDGGPPFDHPFYLSLRLLVGGDGNVAPEPGQPPFELFVDHIRLYRRIP